MMDFCVVYFPLCCKSHPPLASTGSSCLLLLFNLKFAPKRGATALGSGVVITANRLLTSSYLTLLTVFHSLFGAFGHESGSELSTDPKGTNGQEWTQKEPEGG